MRTTVGSMVMAVLLGLVVLGTGAPAQAVGPTVAVDMATGDENSVFRGTGDGFAPGVSLAITVTVDGTAYTGDYTTTKVTDSAGHFTWVWIWDQGDPFGTYTYTATQTSSSATASTTFTITRNGSPPPAEAGSSLMFDARSAPSLATMQSWLQSPYRTIGVYVPVAAGTDNRSDQTQVNLTAPWAQRVLGLGYHVLPIYVGVQAPAGCQPGNFFHMSSVASEAAQQGLQAAQAGAGSVAALGIPTSVPVVYDLESYNAGCSAAVTAFLDGWTVGLHQAGRLSGVYGSQGSTMKDLAARLTDPTFHEPDAVWVATDNRRTTTTGFSNPPDGTFVGQRINQFHLGIDRTFGNQTINVDESVVNDGVLNGTPPVAGPAPSAVPTVATTLLKAVSLDKRVTASWAGTVPGGRVASYDVRVRAGTYRKALSKFTYPAGLQATTATSTTVTVKPGRTWCYSVRSRQPSGVTSGWSAESCTTAPLDDRALAAARGWSRTKDRAAYLRTITATRSAGATLRLPRVRTGRVGLVVAPGSRGSVRVSIVGEVLGTVRAKAGRSQRIVWLSSRKARVGTLVITTTSRQPVKIDGIVISAG